MAVRIEWDKYEVALLIDACEKVLNKQQSKPQIVAWLSSALRKRAQANGISIDDIFRNENGISLQMTKMDYLLSDGKIGLPGASKLYSEIAQLRKSNPTEFKKILSEAKKQVDKSAVEINSFSVTKESSLTKNTESSDMTVSLNKTIEYLKTRYEVRLHYDRFVNPGRYSNDLLYKAKNNIKDIMWIYYIDTKAAHYISIETEPEYLKSITGELKGFTRIKVRASHPCCKMYFEDYESIKKSLIAICDSIDSFYSNSTVNDSNTVQELTVSSSGHKRIEIQKSYSDNKDTASAFYNFLHDRHGLASATCRSYVSAVRTAEQFAREHKYYPFKIFESPVNEAMILINSLLADEQFLEFNAVQHNRFTGSFAKYAEFLGEKVPHKSNLNVNKTIEERKQPNDFDKDKFEQTLLRRYRNGMQFDSIDYENFREMYELLFDERLSFDDSELGERLKYCGVMFKDRLFPAEGIIDNETKEKLFSYIDNSFSSGKKVLYYRAIFEDLAYAFSHCYLLNDEEMLRAYIEYTAPKDKYFFSVNYMSVEQNISIDHNSEVGEYLLSAGKPVATEQVCSALSHIPREQVARIIATDNRFLRNAKGEYFHEDIFEVSEPELNQIAEIINSYIEQNEYAIWTDVWHDIQETMPVFLENNLYLSWLGIRNVLAKHYIGKFNFESAVISLPQNHYAMRDIYQLYAKHHSEFSADNIYELSKELDTVIYFDALAEVSVRVSHDLFVLKDNIHFDIDAVDAAITSFISGEYICIRDIDSYLSFPNVGYEWNEYLLESFVYSYSRKYCLLNNGFSLNNVAGAIVKREGSINEFVDVCAAILSEAPIDLNKNDALNYLAEINMISRRSYKDLDMAMKKAAQMRVMKGK